jgi:hypothetical protein
LVNIKLHENSWIAQFASWKLRSSGCAIVFGRKIFLYNISKQEILSNQELLRHEVAHVFQWKKYGWFRFPCLYVWYSIKHGYYQNPFEIEARNMEQSLELLENVNIS